MTNTGTRLLIALICPLLIATASASAQQSNNQSNPIRPQSTNQIVDTNDSKSAATLSERPRVVMTTTTPQNTPTDAQGKPATAADLAAVIPPAPNVVKGNTTTTEAPSNEPSAIMNEPRSLKRSVAPIDIPRDLFPEMQTTSKPAAKPEARAEVKAEPKFEPRIQLKYESRSVISTAQLGSSFGYRSDPFTGRARFHAGYDIKARWGETVGASLGGIIQFAGWSHGYGNLVVINHGGGVTTHYAHLSSFDVQVGQTVERGQIIGRAGSTGRATSPHLHYELRLDGSPVHPFQPLALNPASDFFKAHAATAATIESADVPKPPLQLMLVP